MRSIAACLVAALGLLFCGSAAHSQTSQIYTITSASPTSVVSGSGDTVITLTGIERTVQTRLNVCFYNGTTSDTIVPSAYNFTNPAAVTYTFTVPGARFQTGTSAYTNSIYIVAGGASVANGCTGANAGYSNTFSYNTTESTYSLRTASPTTVASGSNATTITLTGAMPTFPTNGSGLGLCFYAGINNAPILPTNQTSTSSVAFSVPAASFANAGTAKIYLATASATCTGSNTAYSNSLSFTISPTQRFTFSSYYPNPLPVGSPDTPVTLYGTLNGSTMPNAGVCFLTGATTTPITPSSFDSYQITFTAPAASFQISNASFPSGSYTAYAYLAPYGTQCTSASQNPGISNTQSITIQYPAISSATAQVIPQINTSATTYTPLPLNLEVYGSAFAPGLSALINLGGGRTSLSQAATFLTPAEGVVGIPTLNPTTQPLASISACNNSGSFKYCSPGFPVTAYPLASTSTVLASSVTNPSAGQSTNLTATVTPGAGSTTAGGTFVPGPPTGTLTFSDGSSSLGSSPLVANTLQLTATSTQTINIYAGSDASPIGSTGNAKTPSSASPNDTPTPGVNSQFSSIVADFNKDGINDTLVIQSSSGVLHLFLGGSPLGTIQSEHTIYPGNTYCTSLSGVTVADFNGDGFPDIAFLCGDSGGESTVQLVFNAGDGSFPSQSVYYSTVIANQLAAADVNKDGKIDLVLTGNTGTFCCTGQTFAVQTLLGNGTGNFTAGPVTTTTDVPGTQISLKDLNNDGAPDLTLLHFNATAGKTEVAIYQNDGTGKFTALASLPVCNCQLTNSKLFVTPLGSSTLYPAIVVDYQEGSSVLVFPNKGTSAIAFNTLAPAVFSGLTDALVGDFTGDGLIDLAVYDGTNIVIAAGNGAGVFTPSTQFSPYAAGTGSANLVSLATAQDLNGDGYADLVAIAPTATSNTSTITSYVTTGTAVATLPTQFTSVGAHAITTAYNGNRNVLGSNGTQTVNVVAPAVAPTLLTFAPPSTTASTTATQAYTPGGTFALNFQVNKAASDTRTPPAPTGNVSVSDGTGVLAQATLYALNATSSSASVGSFGSATVGTHAYTISYSGDSSFSPVSQTFTFTVTKAPPAITWTPASSTNTTTALGANILNATASVPGSFAYTPASGYLAAGTQTITALFTPTDTTDYSAITTIRTVTVAKTIPVVTTTINPGNHTYTPNLATTYTVVVTGVNIVPTGNVQPNTNGSPSGNVAGLSPSSAAQSSTSIVFASLPTGAFAFTGTYQGDAVYSAVTSAVTNYTVSKATPTLTYTPTPTSIVYGTGLVTSQLSATAVDPNTGGSIPGAVVYSIPTISNLQPGSILPVGTNVVTAAFTPTDATDYATVTKTANIAVSALPTTINLTVNPSSIIAGQSSTLTATITSTVSGNITGPVTFLSDDGTIPNNVVTASNGVATLVYTPAFNSANAFQRIYAQYAGGSGYGASSSSQATILTVRRGTVVINFVPNPATIAYGAPLSAAQLDAAEANGVPGTFSYTPTLGSTLPVGVNTITAVFSPTDSVGYASATKTATVTVTQAAPVISFSPNPATIAYGTPLVASQLNAVQTTSIPGAFSYSQAVGAILPVGANTITATFTPTDTTNYSTVTKTATITVTQIAPAIVWATPAPIAYGTALSSTQLNAVANDATGAAIPGMFSYSPAVGTVLPAGATQDTVTFTPTNTINFATATATRTITVTQAAPVITWSPVTTTNTTTALDSTILNATASVPGSFAYTPASGYLPFGTQTITAVFTPTSTNYSAINTIRSIVVAKTTPTLSTAVNPSSPVTYAPNLSAAYLATVAGTNIVPTGQIQFKNNGTALNPLGNLGQIAAATSAATYTLTPTTGTNALTASYAGDAVYNAVSSSTINFVVNQATPGVTFNPNPATIVQGQPLTAAQLNAISTVPGAFTYSSAAGTILPAGPNTITATFTPTDTVNYAIATKTAVVTVTAQQVPVINFTPNPATIAYGTPLSAAQLNAFETSSLPGTFTYSVPAGTILTTGANIITATFTPTDTVNYATVTKTATVTVTQGLPAIVFAPNPATISYGTPLSAAQLNAAQTTSVLGAFSYSQPLNAILPVGANSIVATFTPTDTVNYATVTRSSVVTVTQATPIITFTPNPGTIVYGTALSAAQLDAVQTTSIPGAFSYSPAIGTILPTGANTITAIFTPANTTNYATVTKTAVVTVTQAIPVVTFNPNPATITYGTPLSAAQLDAVQTTSFAGGFTYSPGLNSILSAGANVITATFVPSDVVNYQTVTKTAIVTVTQGVPSITWNPATSTTTTTPVDITLLNATSSIPGVFAYTPNLGSLLPFGTQTLTAVFTPTDTSNYATSTTTRTVNVAKSGLSFFLSVNPTSLSSPGQAFLSTVLTGTNLTPAGAIQFFDGNSPLGSANLVQTAAGVASTTLGTALAAGSHSFSAQYTGSAVYLDAISNTLAYTVGGATPTINFAPAPGIIAFGTPLSPAQLNATSNVPGVFTYSPALGAVLNGGVNTITATFTPSDTVAYRIVTQTATVTVTPFNPVIAWAPSSIPFGTPLAAAQLNAIAKDASGTVIAGTYVYSPAASTVLPLGVTQDTVTFTPTNSQNYNVASTSVPITVVSAGTTTSLSLSTGSIDLGQTVTLTATVAPAVGAGPVTGQVTFIDNHGVVAPAQVTLLNGTASVTYTPTSAGTHLLSASFLGTSTYTASSTLTPSPLAVGQQLPVITFTPTPSTIVYGTALSAAQLDAVQTTSVAGVFSYSPVLGTILPVGANTITATFTPTDQVNYGTVAKTAVVTVTQATPVITFTPNPSSISYGTPLSTAQLDAIQTTTSIPGAFSYSPGLSTILPVGANTIIATFIPTDTLDYATVTRSAIVTVTQATPVISFAPNPATIVYGTALSAAQLDAVQTTSIPGAFTYTPALGTILSVGSSILTATFTPVDTTSYSTVTRTATVSVTQALPVINFIPNPATIPYGTVLTTAQLDAVQTTAFPGAFTYSPALGALLSAGANTVTATFTPTDALNYATVTRSAIVTVTQATPVLVWNPAASTTTTTPVDTSLLNATANVPGIFAYTPVLGTFLPAGVQTLSTTFTPTDAVNYTSVTITRTVSVVTSTVNAVLSASPASLNAPGVALFTVTIAGANVAPTGSVTFLDGASILNTVALTPAGAANSTATLSATLTSGHHPIQARYSGDSTYPPVTSNTLDYIVGGAVPTIRFVPSPATIVYGTPLSVAQLDATSPVAGAFSYAPPAGTILDAGSQTITATFTPTDPAYTTAAQSAVVTVTQFTPALSWSAPAPVPYGTPLSATQLNAIARDVNGAVVPGLYVYSPAASTVLPLGITQDTVTFAPTNGRNFATAAATVPITVNAAPTTTTLAATPNSVAVGQPTTLTAIVNPTVGTGTVSGQVTFTDANGTISPAQATLVNGVATLTYTPSGQGTHLLSAAFAGSAPYLASSTLAPTTLGVGQGLPVITFSPNPSTIVYGTPLSAAQLNAVQTTTTIAGTFSYSPALGAILTAGANIVTATFTPADTTNFATVIKTAIITVTQATPRITWTPTPSIIAAGTPLSAAQLDATSSTPGNFIYSPVLGTVLPVGTSTITATLNPEDSLNYATAVQTATITVVSTTSATTLVLTADGQPSTSMRSGSAVTLTATVAAASSPIRGQVNFCDTSASTCSGTSIVGSAQLTDAGTAILHLLPAIGVHTYKAFFTGTASNAASISTGSPLVVTGNYPTTTTFSSTGVTGNFTLTAVVTGTGSAVASPAGVVSFLDTSKSNSLLATAVLTGPSLTQSFTMSSSTASGASGQIVLTADLNNDGIADIITAAAANPQTSSDSTQVFTAWLGSGDGTFTSKAVLAGQGTQVVVGDFNHDGILDVAVSDANSASLLILSGIGDGTFSLQSTVPSTARSGGLLVGDFNHDGLLDLVVGTDVSDAATGTTTGAITVFLGAGDGTFATVRSTIPSAASAIISNDFDGDGIPDLLATGSAGTSGTTATTLLGNGDGTFTQKSTFTIQNGDIFASNDLNGDGIADLASVNFYTSSVSTYLGNGDGTFNFKTTTQNPTQNQQQYDSFSIAFADFNRDGKPDIATVADDGVFLYNGAGDGTFTFISQALPQVDAAEDFGLAVADFNHDGQIDVATTAQTFADGTAHVVLALNTLTSTATATATNVAPIGAGSHLTVASYPGDTTFQASDSAPVNLGGLTFAPALTWTPAPLALGTPLSSAQLNAVARGVDGNVLTGVFTYTPAAGAILPVGRQILSVTFTPSDLADYTPATLNSTVQINSVGTVTSLATSLNPAAYGQSVALTATITPATALTTAVTGTVTFFDGTTKLGTLQASAGSATLLVPALDVGPHSLTAAYAGDAAGNFAASASAALTQLVSAAKPVITFVADPATIVYGTRLTATQLNATARTTAGTTIPGVFSFTPAVGSLLSAGAQTLTATFIPTDTTRYTSTAATSLVTVGRAAPTIIWPTPSAVPVNTVLASAQLNATATGVNGNVLPGTFTYTPAAGSAVTSGSQTLSVLFAPADTANYNSATASVTLNGSAVTLSALSTNTASLGDAAKTITLTGTGFVSDSIARANGAALVTSFVSSTTLSAILPASRFTSVQTLQITVNDPTQNLTTAALPFTVTAQPATARITGPSTVNPSEQPVVQFALTTPYPVDLTGTFSLNFTPVNGSIADPAVQFATGGSSFSTTVAAGQTTIPNLLVQSGTVAGTIRISLALAAGGVDVTPAGLAPLVITIPSVVPAVSSVSLVRSGRQLTVRTIGFSNTREMAKATFHFTPATGHQIDTPDVTTDVGSIFNGWYSQTASAAYGSTFLYVQTFNLDDDADVVGQVTVTLSNAIGTSLTGSSQ